MAFLLQGEQQRLLAASTNPQKVEDVLASIDPCYSRNQGPDEFDPALYQFEVVFPFPLPFLPE